ncbi:MAG: tetratricopeptide repeat protein [Deltaproteobacteria bacterium]|nr:tetratricopeptide repeat protein [Deltaproteobacteria bacterium]
MRPAPLFALFFALACGGAQPGQRADPRYVAEAQCAACHPGAAEAWRGSHHALAMQAAAPGSVLGNFGGAEVEAGGERLRFLQQGGRFFVEAAGADGRRRRFEATHVFGVEPLQQLLIALPGGRLQNFPVAWDTRPAAAGGQRWFHLEAAAPPAPGDPFHWTGAQQTWNHQCAACHSTALRRGYDPERRAYRTTWAQMNVGCQACHGPGADHIAWARKNSRRGPGRAGGTGEGAAAGRVEGAGEGAREAAGGAAEGAWDGAAAVGLAVDFSGAGEVAQCGRCHARRAPLTAEPQPGGPLLDDYAPALLVPGLYYADGQIRGEVYVWGSFLQSRMHQQGVTCGDCHDAHRAATRAEGDALCTRCHSPRPPPRFASLAAKRYDAPSHHHHPPESAAARCVSCHMPARTYMAVDDRRDHSFRIPRPELARFGAPNPCTSCHAGESADWAAAQIATWRGAGEGGGGRRSSGEGARAEGGGGLRGGNERARGGGASGEGGAPAVSHWSALLAAGRGGGPGAARALAQLAEDARAPQIARATALASGAAQIEALLDAAQSAPLLRFAAARASAGLPPAQRRQIAAPLLRDNLRAVRREAALALAAADSGLSGGDARALAAELRDAERAWRAQSDTPGARSQLASLAALRGNAAEALRHYTEALRLDAGFAPAALGIARLHSAAGRAAEAEAVLRRALRFAPQAAELRYALGLLLAEAGRFAEAAAALQIAATRAPHPRTFYNLGLAWQRAGKRAAAERAFLRGIAMAPRHPGLLQALAAFYAEAGDRERARHWARRLAEARQPK